ncbi:MAG TPA: hypothetical protein VNM67_21285 [Thermoanaerobaculia bacterium]|jgi:hypothetical protein|nr:hypothetical protein [Thermoanaerobaculia bacterium]
MKIQTQVKAGGITLNHNQTLVNANPGKRVNRDQTLVRMSS